MKKVVGLIAALFLILTLLPLQKAEASPVNKNYTVNVSKLDVREKPSPKAKVVGSLKKGKIVFVYSTESGGWSKIKYNNKAGYVASSGLKATQGSTTTPPPVKAVPVGTGNLKGTVTWQYNRYIGTKPDVGAKVFLIPMNFDYTKYSESDLTFYGTIGSVPANSNLHFAKVNGYGQYEISDVPAGKYLAVIVSNNTTRDFNQPLYIESTLKPLLGAKAYANFKIMNLNLDKHDWTTIEIKQDKTLDYSEDFGYTYL
ncbi:SH3 domain-containing protein [Domibacillus indicus]|uniref:SH3 domain-containing protein n=1 Tax=Domibacillus indicus TaxID=1437523 RepID=UPI00203B30CC|nr:SH3 domain-containing protein [Domibacillus indicus]MCM3789131.1 SH3 domain-containing protein [Domibacillus indicus]